MQKVQIEISYQDQIYLEDICTKNGLSYSCFFKQLLDIYKSIETEKTQCALTEEVKLTDTKRVTEKENKQPTKKHKRTKKQI